jgi:O6-methylguanine-DNA--protein-cysteine methyltransferase
LAWRTRFDSTFSRLALAAIAAARRYFDGEVTSFSGLPLDLDGGDAFFRKAYGWVRQIERGEPEVPLFRLRTTEC